MNSLVLERIFLLLFPNPLPLLVILPSAGWLSIKYRSQKTDAMLLMALCIVPASLLTITLIKQATVLAPLKYDQFFYLMDMRLGDPAYRIGCYLYAHPVQKAAIEVVYNVLPYELIAVFALRLWKTTITDAWRAVYGVFLLYALIVPLYMLFPAVGPGIAFAGYPYMRPGIEVAERMAVYGAPNCMPSGHFAMTLLTIWQVRKWKWGMVAASAFAALTVIATLGLGEHYVIDLAAAVPYTALIAWLSEPRGHSLIAPELSATHAL